MEFFPADPARPLLKADAAEIGERDQCAVSACDQNVADGLGAVPVLLREADDQFESLLAFVDAGCDIAADRRADDVPDVGDVDGVARDLAPVDIDGEIGLPEELLDLDVPHAAHRAQLAGDLLGFVAQDFQIFPEQLDGGFRPDAGNQLVDPLLDRLADEEGRAGNSRQPLPEFLHQLGHRAGGGPLFQRAEADHRIAFVWLLRIVAQFRAADLGDHHFHLGKFHHGLLHALFDLDRGGERDARQSDRLGGDAAFVQDRDELASQERKQRQAAEQRADRDAEDQGSVCEGPSQRGCIQAFGQADDPGICFAAARQHEGAEDRRQRERQHQGGQQGDHDGVGKGFEHLALHPVQG